MPLKRVFLGCFGAGHPSASVGTPYAVCTDLKDETAAVAVDECASLRAKLLALQQTVDKLEQEAIERQAPIRAYVCKSPTASFTLPVSLYQTSIHQYACLNCRKNESKLPKTVLPVVKNLCRMQVRRSQSVINPKNGEQAALTPGYILSLAVAEERQVHNAAAVPSCNGPTVGPTVGSKATAQLRTVTTASISRACEHMNVPLGLLVFEDLLPHSPYVGGAPLSPSLDGQSSTGSTKSTFDLLVDLHPDCLGDNLDMCGSRANGPKVRIGQTKHSDLSTQNGSDVGSVLQWLQGEGC
jgi:hypothetical protein